MKTRTITVSLTVKSARGDDVYKDIARVGPENRRDLRTGRVHRFRVNGAETKIILRGVTKRQRGFILIDSALREKLHVEYGESYEFQITELGFLGELFWGWGATDPTSRSNARVALIGLGLGVISLLLGVLGVWLGLLALHLS